MTKHNIWSISIIGLLFALLFTPLIVASNLYFPYVTGKVFAFRILVSIACVLWLILIYKDSKFLPKKSSVLITSGVFVVWLAAANSFGVDRMNSFFSNFERMEGWFTHLYLFLYLLIISSVLQTEKIWNWFLNFSIAIANFLALSAVLDDQSRTQVFLGNSTYVAIYVLFNLFFAGFFLSRVILKKTKESSVKYFAVAYYLLSIVLFTYVIFKTQTRGTVLALVFSLALFLVLSVISYWKNKKVRILAGILTLLVIGGSVLFWQNRNSEFIQSNPLLVRVATISATEGTGKARLVNWGIAREGIQERLVFGWGQENYSYVFAQKYDPQMYAQEPWFDRTHNAFLDWAVQGGIPALLLYIALFVTALWTIKTSTSLTRIEKNILISLISAYVIHNMFVFDNYSSYLMFFTLLGFIVHHSQKEKIECVIDEKIKQSAVVILIASVCVISFITIIKPIDAAHDLIVIFKEKDPSRVLDIYKDIYEKKSFGVTEAGIRLISSARTFVQDKDQAVVKKYIETTSVYGNEFVNSDDVRKLESYGTFLLQTGNVPQSIQVLEKAQRLAPDRQNNLYPLAIAYVSNKELQKAKDVLGHAYTVLPENKKARTYYGAILLVLGDKSYGEFLEGYEYTDPFFMSIFAQAGQYKEVIKIREQIKKNNPTDYQNQVSLAVAYSLDKQIIKAIQNIREVQKVVPEFKDQGDYLVKQLQMGKSIGK